MWVLKIALSLVRSYSYKVKSLSETPAAFLNRFRYYVFVPIYELKNVCSILKVTENRPLIGISRNLLKFFCLF